MGGSWDPAEALGEQYHADSLPRYKLPEPDYCSCGNLLIKNRFLRKVPILCRRFELVAVILNGSQSISSPFGSIWRTAKFIIPPFFHLYNTLPPPFFFCLLWSRFPWIELETACYFHLSSLCPNQGQIIWKHRRGSWILLSTFSWNTNVKSTG